MTPPPANRYLTTRVIGDNGGAFVRTVLVSSGARDGVNKNQAALTVDGLVGRVIEVGEHAARVLLLTDMTLGFRLCWSAAEIALCWQAITVRCRSLSICGPMPAR